MSCKNKAIKGLSIKIETMEVVHQETVCHSSYGYEIEILVAIGRFFWAQNFQK